LARKLFFTTAKVAELFPKILFHEGEGCGAVSQKAKAAERTIYKMAFRTKRQDVKANHLGKQITL
jgi:hypothetical protein